MRSPPASHASATTPRNGPSPAICKEIRSSSLSPAPSSAAPVIKRPAAAVAVGLKPWRRCVSRTRSVVTPTVTAKPSSGADALMIKSRITRAAMPRGSPCFLPERRCMRVLVIHGPNLNLLGERKPEVYGTQTLEQVDARIAQLAGELKLEVLSVQHNSEGAIVDELHAARGKYDAIIINPGAYTHYAYAIADAIEA